MFDPYGYIQREQEAMRDQETISVNRQMYQELLAALLKQQSDVIMLTMMCQMLNAVIDGYKKRLDEKEDEEKEETSNANLGDIFGLN